MKYTIVDLEGREWEIETLPRQVTPNFIGMTEEEKQKIRKECELIRVPEKNKDTND